MALPRRDLNDETSLTLLERARANDPDAWSRLFALYTPIVKYWCFLGGLQETDVDDVVQDVYRSALSGLARFRHDRPDDSFRGWLRTVTRNALALHFRKNARVPYAKGGSAAFLLLQDVADPRVELPDDDPPAQVRGLYRRALELVRSEFEDRTWQMFWLTVVEDHGPDAVAEQFGVTPVTIRKAKSRVLRRLREELGDLLN